MLRIAWCSLRCMIKGLIARQERCQLLNTFSC